MESREEGVERKNWASKHYGEKTITLLKAYQSNAQKSTRNHPRARSLNFERSASGYFHSPLHPVMGTLSIPARPSSRSHLVRNAILPANHTFSRPRSAASSSTQRPTTSDRRARSVASKRRRSGGSDLRTWRQRNRGLEERIRSMHVSGKNQGTPRIYQGNPVRASGPRRRSASAEEAFETPEDGIIFAVSPTIPGYPVVYRTEQERSRRAERLELDKRDLPVCPIVEGEGKLRLLNYQNNAISQISNLANLPNLILVDMHANCIEKVENLDAQRNLRVLLLGKNRIKAIENINHCTKLDVLDLQSNLITRIANVDNLSCLRVLNLSGNALQVVDNLTSLQALVELNLSRNKIERVRGVDKLSSLERLFLADNRISKYEMVQSVLRISNTTFKELSIAGNMLPSVGCLNYQQVFLDRLRNLEQMDQKPVTKAMRQEIARKAAASSEKEESNPSKDKEVQKEEVRQLWNQNMRGYNATRSRCSLESWISTREGVGRVFSQRQVSIPGYCETVVHNGAHGIRILGTSLKALDDAAMLKSSAKISCVFLSFSTLSSLLIAFSKLEAIKTAKHLSLSFNALSSLDDVAQIVEHLPSSISSVTITENKVTELELYRPWFIHCVSKFKKRVLLLDNHYIKKAESSAAKKLFQPISDLKSPWQTPICSTSSRGTRSQVLQEAGALVDKLFSQAKARGMKEQEADAAWTEFLRHSALQ